MKTGSARTALTPVNWKHPLAKYSSSFPVIDKVDLRQKGRKRYEPDTNTLRRWVLICKVGEVTEKLSGHRYSRSTVSRITDLALEKVL